MWRRMFMTVMIVVLASALLIIGVFASGATFGQRCQRAYPDRPLEAERCAERLAHGGTA
jgi:hypothetical protein